jgi:hypothetical protein
MGTPPSQVTELLRRWSRGDQEALDALVPLVYEDLRRLASSYLQQEGQAQTLQSTALVHEVYLRPAISRTRSGMDELTFSPSRPR